MRSLLLSLVFAHAIVFPALASSDEAVLIRAGTVIDVQNGKALHDQVILIRGNRIVSVQSGGDASAAAGARVIDLSGYTVLPGLIDTHTHVTADPDLPPYHDYGLSNPRIALMGAAHARKTLLAGVTTIRDVGATGFTDVALRDAINAGDVPGPRMLVAGPALSITGGHCDDNMLAPEFDHSSDGVADGVEGVRRAVRRNSSP